jgi:hypothetical protein
MWTFSFEGHLDVAALNTLQNKPGSCPDLVKQGGLKVLPRFLVRRRVGKTAPSLGESCSFSLVEVLILSTSPNLAKSPCNLAKPWEGSPSSRRSTS